MGIEINFPKIISLQNDRTDSYISRIRDEIHPAVGLKAFFPSSCVSLSFFNSIFMIFSWNFLEILGFDKVFLNACVTSDHQTFGVNISFQWVLK